MIGWAARRSTTTSELLARYLPTSRIVKAFNAIPMNDLESDGRPAGAPDRRALPIAGDDAEGKAIAAAWLEALGFGVVDVGPLAEGWRFERDRPAYCVPLDRARSKRPWRARRATIGGPTPSEIEEYRRPPPERTRHRSSGPAESGSGITVGCRRG